MHSNPDSQLFTLRIWSEEISNGHTEWRGRLQHGLHGEARHFRGWSNLVDIINEFLTQSAWSDIEPATLQDDLQELDVTVAHSLPAESDNRAADVD